MEIKELLGWLKAPNIPIGSTLFISDILKMHFYASVPDQVRDKVVLATINNLADTGYITISDSKITKQDFIEY